VKRVYTSEALAKEGEKRGRILGERKIIKREGAGRSTFYRMIIG
jgi:predicted DNA-binding transcriptional regulator AlpA